jgi:hypothetical protein
MNKFPMFIVCSDFEESYEIYFSTEEAADTFRHENDPNYMHLYVVDLVCEADLDQYLEDKHGLFATNRIA